MVICTSSHTYTNTPQHKYTSHSLGHRPHPPSVSCLKRVWERGHTACTPSTQTSPTGERPYSLYTLNTDSPLPPFPYGKEAIQLVHPQHRLLPFKSPSTSHKNFYFPNVYHFNTPYYCGHSTWKLNVGSCETLWRKVMTEDTLLIQTLEQVPDLYREEQNGSALLWCLLACCSSSYKASTCCSSRLLKTLTHSNMLCCTAPKLYLWGSTNTLYWPKSSHWSFYPIYALNQLSLLMFPKCIIIDGYKFINNVRD